MDSTLTCFVMHLFDIIFEYDRCITIVRWILSSLLLQRVATFIFIVWTKLIRAEQPVIRRPCRADNDHDDRRYIHPASFLATAGELLEPTQMMMERLGIGYHPEGDKIGTMKDVAHLFDENEPSVEEVKEAFDVFDRNKDGYIDAQELGRVLSAMGFMQDHISERRCLEMIERYDDDRDGRINFREFLKLVEASLDI